MTDILRWARVAWASLALFAPAARSQEPTLGTNTRAHLGAALHALNMSETDLGFDKDIARPKWALSWVRSALRAPLELPPAADRILAATGTHDPPAAWRLAAALTEAGWSQAVTSAAPAWDHPARGPAPAVLTALDRFLDRAQVAGELLQRAVGRVGPSDRAYAAASHFAGTFNAEDDSGVRADLCSWGVSSQLLEAVIAEGNALDPEPAADRFLAIFTNVDRGAIAAAGCEWHAAVLQLRRDAGGISNWPASPIRLSTPLGAVVVGTPGADVHTNASLLVLDPGGDDRYGGAVGVADGVYGAGLALAAIVDLAGADRYESPGPLGIGSAVFGLCAVVDAGGDDTYAAAYAGQGTALFGAAVLVDEAGDDTYRARGFAQGAALAGVGMLDDASGDDTYRAGLSAQACAGVGGFALLVDRAGNDAYSAGGVEPDHERNPGRFISLSQGFAIGIRPFIGGGVAALVDLAGSDCYEADVYGQGVSYWYSAAFLLDRAGNDRYSVYQYGQGTGIHLSLGLLADGCGDDVYSGSILVQGSAHDYAVGMLFDRAGDDTYTGDSHAQARAINSSFALLADEAGQDAYFGRQKDHCQGIGNEGMPRDYGSLAVLLDLGGGDQYSCGALDGIRMKRPLYGIVYDDPAPTKGGAP